MRAGLRSRGLDDIYDVDAEVYSPCALGATVNEKTIAAHSSARSSAAPPTTSWPPTSSATSCSKRGILYAPDYAINAGGVMNVSLEIDGYNRERAMRMVRTIYYNIGRIFKIAERDDIPTYKAADRLAEERINAIGKIKLPHGMRQSTSGIRRLPERAAVAHLGPSPL